MVKHKKATDKLLPEKCLFFRNSPVETYYCVDFCFKDDDNNSFFHGYLLPINAFQLGQAETKQKKEFFHWPKTMNAQSNIWMCENYNPSK